MRIERLRVENIRSYREGEMRLGAGTTLLAGDVGAGKTSLLYSIEMALFGFAEVEPAYLVRHQAKRAEVTLVLRDGERVYELRRRFARRVRKGRDTFEIEESSFAQDGARTRYSATELRQRAIDLLGFPDNPNPRAHSDFWRWAVYIPQERMRDVLLQEPAERLETVRKALGLEQFRVAADNASEVAAELRRTAETREAEAERMRHWEEELPHWSEVRDHRAAELGRLESEERDRRQRRERADAAFALAEDARRRREVDERERARVAEERDTLGAEAARWDTEAADHAREAARLVALAHEATARQSALDGRASEVPSWRERLDRVRAELVDLDAAARMVAGASAARDAAGQALMAAREEDEAAQRELALSRETVGQLEAERPRKEPPAPTPRSLPEIDEAIECVRGEMEAAVSRVADLTRIASDLDELLRVGTCPRCRQPVRPEDHRRHGDEARSALAEEERHLDARRASVRSLGEERQARERFEKAHLRWEEVEKRRAAARDARTRAEERARHAAERLASTRAELDTAESRLSDSAERAAPREERLRERDRLEGRLREWEEVAPELSRLAERARSSVEQARVHEQSAARARQESRAATERCRTLTAELDRLGRNLNESARTLAGLTEVERERSATQAALEETLRRRAAAASERDEAERRIREAEAGRRERAELRAEAAHLSSLADWIAREFREGVLRLERRLLAHAQADFDRHFSRYFTTLIEDPSLVARCDIAFSPLVEIDGQETPPEALSGGERTALALAFRLAMGRVVRQVGRLQLDTLILDEPTDGFSPEQVERLGELFDDVGVGQVLLVSHEAQLSAIADRIIRVRKERGESELVDEGPGARGASAARTTPSEPAPTPEPPPSVAPLAAPRRRGRRPRPLEETAE